MTRTCLIVLVVVSLGLFGCLERKEKITVEADGTVLMEATFETDSFDELYTGDAVPSLEAGWLVEESIQVDDEGKEYYRLTAQFFYPPEVELPENFAVPDDPQAGLYLQFPTAVAIEERRDGTYYHFHRTYPRRAWAHIDALHQLLVEEKLKDVSGKKDEDLTREDRTLMLSSFADFEVAKMLMFARSAFLEVTPDAPQDGWLQVHAAINTMKAGLDYLRLASLMELDDRHRREEALAQEAQRWEEESLNRLQAALAEFCGYGGAQMSAFLHRYDWLRRSFEITQDLGDDAFEITVVMPGEIVGSNADSTFANRAIWKFSGERFRDRDVELMVSSRLAY
ncbi:MAG: hypothetical protein IH889_08090 [Planctomycetes bacterium]|nr:hypothetical protein [Planctomycetota bacterium]